MKRLLCVIFSLLPTACYLQPLHSQPLNSIYENNTLVSFEKYAYGLDSSFHTSIRPYLVSDMKKVFKYDSLLYSYTISRSGNYKNSSAGRRAQDPGEEGTGHRAQGAGEEGTGRRAQGSGQKGANASSPSLPPSAFNLIFNRNLFIVNKEEYGFTIDPLFDWGAGYDFKNKRNTWVNTRGFLITGYLGKDFAFASTFYENQSKVPVWIDNYVSHRGNMPGQGRVKPFGDGAWDYANVSGYVSYSPGKYFNFQLGTGKQIWGDGFRSLMLSDFSLYHPYFMITTTFWKIKYVNLYSQFSHPDKIDHVSSGGDPVYAKKFSTMHYLSFAPGKRWNISLFESIIWQAYDSTYYRGFDFSYLNPVIFYRPVEFNLGSGDNAMIGMNLRYTAAKGIALYSQLVFDEFKIDEIKAGNGWVGNKYAWQVGVKTFDLLGITNLNFQAEANLIRPYMYSHYTQVQNYSNAREPLAHPMGANTKEAVVIAKYNWKRLYFNAKYIWSGFGLDSAGVNFGKNIFNSPNDASNEYGNYTTQGLYTTLNQIDMTVSYLVNPSTNMNVFIGATFRRELNSKMENQYSYFSFGFRTSLRNLYYDFY